MKPRLALLALSLLALAGCLYERRAARRARERFQPPGERIDIGGRCLHLLRLGDQVPGQPTVILEAGHGDWSGCWRLVQPAIARFARVIAYDRAGFGWSDPGPLPRSPLAIVTELHDLLEKAGERGPYLLVGHSLGAAFCRLYSACYPGEVVGMVWVDSAHEDMDRYIPFWPAAYWGILAATRLGSGLARLGLVRLFGSRLALLGYPSARSAEEQALVSAQSATPRFFQTMYAETIGWRRQAYWGRQADWQSQYAWPSDFPITLLEAQYPSGRPLGIPPGLFWQQYQAGWRTVQDDLSCLSSAARRVRVASGHVISAEQPDMIVQAVKEMLEIV